MIFDTTLRDGEQAAGAAMTEDQKVEIAHKMAKMGVDVIEAGFAVSSEEDFNAIHRISKELEGTNTVVCSLARACKGDIDAAAKALAPAIKRGRGRIHVFISTSEEHMRDKMKKTPEEVLKMTAEMVKYARKYTDNIEWSGEDAFRSDRDFLAKCVQAAVNNGASIINLPDTIGHAVSSQYHDFIKDVRKRAAVPEIICFSTHCHNDKGLATANTLAGIEAGARQVEVSVNGLGERAGNAALEEVIMAMYYNRDVYPFDHNIQTKMLKEVSRMVERHSGFHIGRNKAIVGESTYDVGSGIHQDGIIKAKRKGKNAIYASVPAHDVGMDDRIVLTRHSGKTAVADAMMQMGHAIPDDMAKELTAAVKKAGAEHKVITSDMLFKMFNDRKESSRVIVPATVSVESDTRGRGREEDAK